MDRGGPQRYFLAGDPLRAIAMLGVFTCHASTRVLFEAQQADRLPAFGSVLDRALPAASNAIFIFFVLSGYLLAKPFIAAGSDRGAFPPIGRYLVNRVLRIVPAFWVVGVAVLLVFGTYGSAAHEVLAIFAFAQTWDPGRVDFPLVQAWTLDAEMAFYLLLPVAALVFVRGRFRAPAVCAAIAVVTIASFVLRAWGPGRHIGDATPPAMLFAFAPGIGLAAIEVRWGSRLHGLRSGPSLAWALLAAGVVAFIVAARVPPMDIASRTLLAAFSGSALVAAPLLLQLTHGRTWRGLDHRALHWLGARSYSMYLVHRAVLIELSWFYTHGTSPWAQFGATFVVGLAVSVVVSAALYRYVERPALALRRSWRTRAAAAAARGPAPAPAVARRTS